MVLPIGGAHDEPMNCLSRVRITAFAATLALFTLAASVSPSFAAEQASSTMSTTTAHSSVTAPATTSIIMRDGGVCDPIRHMGC